MASVEQSKLERRARRKRTLRRRALKRAELARAALLSNGSRDSPDVGPTVAGDGDDVSKGAIIEMFSDTSLKWWKTSLSCLRPPPTLSVSEWADRHRVISAQFSARPGAWRTSSCEFMREVMDAASASHSCTRIVLCKSTQVGGSEALVLNVVGYTIDVNPRSILLVFPTLETAQSFSKERLEPMIGAMPRLNAKVAEVRGGAPSSSSERSTLRSKAYPGGILNLVGANSTSGLSSRPIAVAIMDEVDSCCLNGGAGGNPIRLLTARTSTFSDTKKEIFIGSPVLGDEESGILQLWRDSSRGKLETSCPKCGAFQVLDFAHMDIETALLACSACGVESSQWQWNGREFASSQRWRHEVPVHETQGFRLTGLNSPWLDWKRDLCEEFREAHRMQQLGDESLMKVFCNTRLAEPYRLLGQRVEIDLYHERRERYPCHDAGADVPDGVLLVTVSVDTQDTYLVYEIVGWGRGRESWGIETGMLAGDPRKADSGVFDRLDEVVYNRVLKFADGALIRPRIVFIDSGGHATTQVYQYAAKRHPRVFAIKGVGSDSQPMIIGGRVRDKTSGAWLLRLGVNALKEEMHSRLNVAAPGPGFCHWPCGERENDVCGYSEAYFKELVAEQRILKYSKGGFAKFEWHKQRIDNNEAFDLRCYARAALEYLKVRLEQMTRDELRAVNQKSIEIIETVEGQAIMNYKLAAGARNYELRTPGRTLNALSEEAEAQRAPAEMPLKRRPAPERYGSVSNSF